jgi:hypothetical protein
MVSHDPVEEPDCDDELMQLLFQGHCQQIADAAAVVCHTQVLEHPL